MPFNKCDLDRTQLPTTRHVIEYLMFVRHKGIPNVKKNQKLNVYTNYVAESIIELWQRTKVPLLGQQSVRKLILKFLKKYENMMRRPGNYNEEDWNKLFMIFSIRKIFCCQ